MSTVGKNEKYKNIAKKETIWKRTANGRLYFFSFPAKIPPRTLPIPIVKIVMVEIADKKLFSDFKNKKIEFEIIRRFSEKTNLYWYVKIFEKIGTEIKFDKAATNANRSTTLFENTYLYPSRMFCSFDFFPVSCLRGLNS